MFGEDGDDIIFGDGASNALSPSAPYIAGTKHTGNDTIYGDAGNDQIYDEGDTGGAGDTDIIDGGAGIDTIAVDDGDDTDIVDNASADSVTPDGADTVNP